MTWNTMRGIALTLPAISFLVVTVCSAQTLETETARPLPKGTWEVASAYEYQYSSEGSEVGVPFGIEYGATRAIDILVEPVFYTAIDPVDSGPGPHATGIGDLELTVSGLIRGERTSAPAIALAGEVKLPTAQNTLIGTGRTDVAGYVILSKRFGSLDTHANLSYTVIGQPAGVQLNNTYGFAVAGMYRSSGPLTVFGEVLGSSAASPESDAPNGSIPSNAVAIEAPGAELVGTLGVGTNVRPDLFASLSVSYDNNNAVLFRPGLVFTFE